MRDALRGSWYLLVTSVLGIAWASCLVSLLATGVATLVVVVGAFVLIATARLVDRAHDIEVRRAARYLRAEVATAPARVRPARSRPATLPERVRLAWPRETVQRAARGILRMVTGPLLLSVTITMWAVPLGLVATPILVAAGLEPTSWTDGIDSVVDVDEWPAAIGMVVAGLALVPVAVVLLRGLATTVAGRWAA